jgi:hypothetical protein
MLFLDEFTEFRCDAVEVCVSRSRTGGRSSAVGSRAQRIAELA